MGTYSDPTFQDAITITRATCLPRSVVRGCRAFIVEAAVGTAPHASLPVMRHVLIPGLAWLKFESRAFRTISSLCSDAWMYSIWALVRDYERSVVFTMVPR